MLPTSVTVGPLDTADANGISEAQTAAGAGALALDGILVVDDVAVLDVARRVLVTSSGDDTGITFRITGTNSDGNPIRETLTGVNATTVATVQDFKTVTEVYVSGATDGDVEVGTDGVASSPWKLANSQHQAMTQIDFAAVISGTVNYDLEYTLNDIQAPNGMGGALGNYPPTPKVWGLTGMTGKSADAEGSRTLPIMAWRVKINSGTGSVTVTAIEGGVIQGG